MQTSSSVLVHEWISPPQGHVPANLSAISLWEFRMRCHRHTATLTEILHWCHGECPYFIIFALYKLVVQTSSSVFGHRCRRPPQGLLLYSHKPARYKIIIIIIKHTLIAQFPIKNVWAQKFRMRSHHRTCIQRHPVRSGTGVMATVSQFCFIIVQARPYSCWRWVQFLSIDELVHLRDS